MLDLLEKGEGIVIFPEGTYYRSRMGPGRVGLIRWILSRSRVHFIPVGINYTARRTRTLAQINFGRPIYGNSMNNAESLLSQMMKEIARLSGF
jgi:1-acyl-sn-glycerol-3-phosphate acyltransferase